MGTGMACSGLREKVDISQHIERRGYFIEELLRIICTFYIVATLPDV